MLQQGGQQRRRLVRECLLEVLSVVGRAEVLLPADEPPLEGGEAAAPLLLGAVDSEEVLGTDRLAQGAGPGGRQAAAPAAPG